MMNKSVVFSGHRSVNEEHHDLIRAKVENVYLNADHLFFGCAAGFDTIALKQVLDMARSDGGIGPHVWLVVPAALEQQPKIARETAEQALEIFPKKFTLIEMNCEYNGESLKARNREMIDRAISLGNPELVCYFTGIFKSGTYSTMCYAKKMGVPITQIVP